MAVTTVAQFAAELDRPATALLEQLHSAGVKKASTDDALTDGDKERLLDYLRTAHGTGSGERKKITLTKKSTTEIKQADASGKARTIQVEVRKKRTFVKRDEVPAAEEAAPPAPLVDEAELQKREEEASRQAEQLRRQEEDIAEKRRLREAQEQADREAAEARQRAAAEEAASALAAAAAAPVETPAKKKAAAKNAAAAAEAAPPVPPAPVEVPKPALRVVKAADIENEEKQRLADLAKRRKAAEDEASAIRAMMNAPKKVLVAKKEEPKPAEGIKGTIHKPTVKPGAPGAAAPGVAKPGDKKSVKSEKLSSSWADDAAKKRAALRGRPDTGGRGGWKAPRGGRRGGDRGEGASAYVAPAEAQVYEVHVPETISVADLAHKMSVKASEVIKQLMKLGQMVTINQQLDQETAMILVEEMGHKAFTAKLDDPDAFLEEDVAITDVPSEPRAPVVTVMGHVDHGKTSLLDAIRSTNVVSGEAGGITQHIGAYQVDSPLNGKITFIDTPGHAAFTAMRARGAKVTDIVVLVVAADDGVMPQTIEAINHAKAAKVPMIVAINKIDKTDAKPERVRSELLQYEVQVESLGGDVVDVELSATKRTNLDKLLEMIALQAEILDLKANATRPAEGTVIEAKLDRGRGPVATVLIQRGTLHIGDLIVAGAEWGRVRALVNDKGESVQEAGPSVPVEVLGFSGTP
ncbi:translation initiation factor IF-2, partial [Methylibium sp.]|uniref:translation initiation factor IF-2 n=1 Tax=Methylibium sp. TaxID=2067992 RepID=UPI00286A729E